MTRRALVLAAVVVLLAAAGALPRALSFWSGGAVLAAGVDRPSPTKVDIGTPLGRPMPPPAAGGPHRFMALQDEVAKPVAYDPCRPINVVVNERAAPDGAARLLAESIDVVAAITGLRFVVEGTTDEPPTADRAAYQPERYGDRWAPVLVAWSDAIEVPLLAGPVAGMGGSTAIEHDSGLDVYVTGRVVLDGPQLDEVLAGGFGWERARAVVLHELGHVVGLDHVDDAGQLLFHGTNELTDFQDGDLTGLAQLGAGACFREL